MKNLEQIKNHIAERNASDSGDPLVTGLIIIGVMAVIALAVYLAFGNALADRGDDVAQDIQDSGQHFEDRGNIKFGNESDNR